VILLSDEREQKRPEVDTVKIGLLEDSEALNLALHQASRSGRQVAYLEGLVDGLTAANRLLVAMTMLVFAVWYYDVTK
jgi:hypothetical protein